MKNLQNSQGNSKSKHEERECPRCGCSFVCKRADIANCDCNSIRLLPQTLKFLQSTNYDCLCPNCLREINHLVEKSLEESFPSKTYELKEGTHFYWEDGCIVFTEYYHILRGFCCKSGCRHCAYGYGKRAKYSIAAKIPSLQSG